MGLKLRNFGLLPFDWERLKRLPQFFRDYREFKKLEKRSSFSPRWKNLYPMLDEYTQPAGLKNIHYFQQDLWAARKVRESDVSKHTDVGSLVHGFIGQVLTFAEVDYIDIRPLPHNIRGLHFIQADATNLENFDDNSLVSLSSLHAAEHFGLGRYGDPIDPDACFAFMRSLQRVLAPGGRLYFSTPVGRERTEFNGHRVFAPQTIVDSFDQLQLLSFAVVSGNGDLVEGCQPSDYAAAGLVTGLYEFTKA